jgi:hypothetical protein
MSFDATRPFPQENLSGQNLQNVPKHSLFPDLVFPGPFNIAANLTAGTINTVRRIPRSPSDVAYAKWAVGFFNDHLGKLGYQIKIPSPGGRIPRDDMLPALSIFSVGMSGMSGLSERNDGVVDTASMRAPANQPVQDIKTFNRAAIPRNRGVYWDLGLTEGVDHADEVGVFTDPDTVSTAKPMINAEARCLLELPQYNRVVLPIYRQLGELVSAL